MIFRSGSFYNPDEMSAGADALMGVSVCCEIKDSINGEREVIKRMIENN